MGPAVARVIPLLVLLSLSVAASLGPSAPHHSLQTLMRLRGGAEAGKGDPRWIVQDREDGKNVGSWHWEERDMLLWAKEQLPRLVLGARGDMADFEGYSGHFEVTNITTLTGDCVIHLRKGKLWPLCDLNVVLAIKGTCQKEGKASPVAGSITFPEVTMDDRDDLEVKATTSSRGEASEVFGRWLRKEGYTAAEKAVHDFLDALDAKAGQDKPPEDVAEKMRAALAAAEKMAQVNKCVDVRDVPTPTDEYEDKGEPTGRIELQEDFFCSAADIYDCLTVASRINAYSRCSDTMVELRVGGRFSMFAGKTTGGFEELTQGGHIKCKWRMADWRPGQFSNLRIDIHDRGPGEGCSLELVQDAIPSHCVDGVTQHWKEFVLNQIKRTFGYGNLSGDSLLR